MPGYRRMLVYFVETIKVKWTNLSLKSYVFIIIIVKSSYFTYDFVKLIKPSVDAIFIYFVLGAFLLFYTNKYKEFNGEIKLKLTFYFLSNLNLKIIFF
jgi:hypothetical protein